MIKLAVFDLDGTLLNTIGDLADACNLTLEHYGHPKRSEEEIEAILGYGVRNLVERIMPEETELTEAELDEALMFYTSEYNKKMLDRTKPYPGVIQLIEKLQEDGVKLAVLSNKYHPNTVDIINHYFKDTFEIVIGDRAGVPRKPDPTSLNEIMNELGVKPEETVYIGDSEADYRVSVNAGVVPAVVTWGFRSREHLEEIGAENLVDNTDQLYQLIKKH